MSWRLEGGIVLMKLIRVKMRIEGIQAVLLDWTMRGLLANELITHLLQCELTGDKVSLVIGINSMEIADI